MEYGILLVHGQDTTQPLAAGLLRNGAATVLSLPGTYCVSTVRISEACQTNPGGKPLEHPLLNADHRLWWTVVVRGKPDARCRELWIMQRSVGAGS